MSRRRDREDMGFEMDLDFVSKGSIYGGPRWGGVGVPLLDGFARVCVGAGWHR